MPEVYADALVEVARALLLAGVATMAFTQCRDSAERSGRFAAMRRAAGWILAIALFAAFTLGRPTCEDSGGPLNGNCEQYAEDGFAPSTDERGGRFLFWTLLLGVPAGFGLMTARRNKVDPWRKPDDVSV